MAFPTFVNNGAEAAAAAGITPALPASLATNDILFLAIETSNEVISISNSNGGTWTAVTNSPVSGGELSSRLTMFWSRYNGTQGAPTTTDSGNHQIGFISAWRGCPTTGDPWDTTISGVDAFTGGSTSGADRLILGFVADNWDNASTTRYSAWTNASLANILERWDDGAIIQNGGGLGMVSGEKATSGAFNAYTVTANANITNALTLTIALKPATAAFTLAVDSGVYTITGTAATLKAARRLSVDSGTYTISGSAATLSKGFKITADPGSYALTGTAATLLRNAVLAAVGGTYVIAGTDAGLRAARVIAIGSGSYAIVGTDATLIFTPSGGGGGTYTMFHHHHHCN